jgi:hypothetical protein
VHAISNGGALNNHTVVQIDTACNADGMAVTPKNGRLIMPTDRAEIKKLLRFLDDVLYQAPLTGVRYVTNSKRPAQPWSPTPQTDARAEVAGLA